MLSCDTLGNNGRLGNQIFQYAAIKGIAMHNKLEFCIPRDNHQLFDCFKMSKDIIFNKNINKKIFKERFFEFDQDLFNNIKDNIDLFGYFQTEKYFLNIINDLMVELEFNDNIKEESYNFLKNLEIDNLISIHVRRGDYVNLQHYHGLCSLDYYRKAINNFDERYHFLIFSDDIDWCKKKFIGKRFFFSEKKSTFVDLCLMSLCKHNIIANSSYSWWGAYLNKNKEKKVIAPQKWFEASLNTKDLYQESWIKI